MLGRIYACLCSRMADSVMQNILYFMTTDIPEARGAAALSNAYMGDFTREGERRRDNGSGR